MTIRTEDPDKSRPGEWRSVNNVDDLLNIPSGSYLIRAVFPDGREIFLPMEFEPGLREKLDLSAVPAIPEGFVYVKGGGFPSGDTQQPNSWMRYLPDYFIQKNEVTIGDYLKFWHQLKDPALKNEFRAVYREAGELGRFVWDENGALPAPFTPDMPVFGIAGSAAEAYCRYMTAKTGMVHRLPTQLEWEKAARGADGRRFVWGNEVLSDAAFTADHPARKKHHFALPAGRFPLDRSVYGAWDMAGNLREMVRNPDDSGSIYRLMGGSYQLGHLQSTTYHLGSTNNGVRDAGFRCVIEIPQSAGENSL